MTIEMILSQIADIIFIIFIFKIAWEQNTLINRVKSLEEERILNREKYNKKKGVVINND